MKKQTLTYVLLAMTFSIAQAEEAPIQKAFWSPFSKVKAEAITMKASTDGAKLESTEVVEEVLVAAKKTVYRLKKLSNGNKVRVPDYQVFSAFPAEDEESYASEGYNDPITRSIYLDIVNQATQERQLIRVSASMNKPVSEIILERAKNECLTVTTYAIPQTPKGLKWMATMGAINAEREKQRVSYELCD